MKVVYSDRYAVRLDGHPWHPSKYGLVLERLKREGVITGADVIQAEMADDEDILRVHSPAYWRKLYDLDFSAEEAEALELPLTTGIVDLFWRFAGGTLQASE